MSPLESLSFSFAQPTLVGRTCAFGRIKINRAKCAPNVGKRGYNNNRGATVTRAKLATNTTNTNTATTTSTDALRRPPGWLLRVNEGLVGGALRGIDMLYGGQAGPWSRLWVLEVVARVPYFSFLCALHLAETLGYGNDKITALQRAHFAEADNEAAHLAIMEALGGGSQWRDRFVAQHAAILYYWLNIIAYFISPSLSYHFSHLVENHAYNSYNSLLENQEHFLKFHAPIPLVAREYYASEQNIQITSMYDAIRAIRDDEAQHATDLAEYCDQSFDNVPWRHSAPVERD